MRRALSAKLGICEHGVHNCDSGFRRLTSVENKLHGPCMAFYCAMLHSPKTEALRNHRNLPKTIRQIGAKADCQASSCLFSVHGEQEEPKSASHSHLHSSHDSMFWLV